MTTGPCPGSTWVVMPVYDEAATIGDVLDAVRVHFGGEIVVVDDGSTDGTGAIIGSRPGVHLVRHDANHGYGASLAEGIRTALDGGAGVVVTMDCDNQHEPRHIPEFCEKLRACGTDIVSGSRYLPASGAVGDVPPDRLAVNKRVTEAVNAVTGWGLTDAFCGFKAYRADALALVPLDEPGYAMPLQFWARAWRAGLSVCEMPVERIYNDTDRSFGQDLDDPEKRYAYYMRVWERTLAEGYPKERSDG